METPKWLIALVAATSFALAACDNAQKASNARPRPSLTGRDIQGDNARSYDVQQQTLKDVRTLLTALQKKVKDMPRSVGFGTKPAKKMKEEWLSLKSQLGELRQDLDESGGDPELKQAMDELMRNIDYMIKWLEKQM